MMTERVTTVTELELARLAIELARLRGQKEPTLFLDEAARLLTEARFALSREERRPERERQSRSEASEREMMKLLAPSSTWTFGAAKKSEVPFELLYKPGKSEGGEASKYPPTKFVMQNGETPPKTIEFAWQPFTSRRGFLECLKGRLSSAHRDMKRDAVNTEADKWWKIIEAGKFPIERVHLLHEYRKWKDSKKSQKAMNTRLAQSKPKT